jgi:hypothetical protein
MVKFSRILDTECLTPDNFKLLDESGEDLGLISPISVENDYDPVAKILELRLSSPLEASSEYILVIDGLFDAMGDSQDAPNITSFMTNNSSADLIPNIAENSVIGVVDKTIANSDLVQIANANTNHRIYMNPADGAYNVQPSFSQITLTFMPADLVVDVSDVVVTVEKRLISDGELSWTDIGAASAITDEAHVTVDLPSMGASYIEPGYEYQVSVSVGTEEPTVMRFLGTLDPMFASVTSALQQSPSLASIDVARMIYLSSTYVLSLDTSMASNPTKAAKDYALYNTLAMLSPIDTMESYTLADLKVKRAKSQQQRFAELAEEALSRMGGSPKFLVKGSANESPHAKRDFGSSNVRIGK